VGGEGAGAAGSNELAREVLKAADMLQAVHLLSLVHHGCEGHRVFQFAVVNLISLKANFRPTAVEQDHIPTGLWRGRFSERCCCWRQRHTLRLAASLVGRPCTFPTMDRERPQGACTRTTLEDELEAAGCTLTGFMSERGS
jgi:hypothetical protein